MTPHPTALELAAPDLLHITWSDGQTLVYPVRHLRDNCPCATCREQRNAPPPSPLQLPIITEAQTHPLRIADMKPVGNYAYSIDFSDGHDTGIYTLETLRALGRATQT
ncbi:MAG: DUF971 domain-containing protein [Pirellulales bacterium]|nr:DUF971 domain-containing protein [Pirellulales bacterium]